MQPTIQFLEFKNFSHKEITVTVWHFRIGDMNHLIVNVEIQFGTGLKFASQTAGPFRPDNVFHFMFEAQQIDQ